MESKAAKEIVHTLLNRKVRVIFKQNPTTTKRNNLSLPIVSITGITCGFDQLALKFREYVKSNNTSPKNVIGIVYGGGEKIGLLESGIDTEGEDNYNVVMLQPESRDLIYDEATKRREIAARAAKKSQRDQTLYPNRLAQWTLWGRTLNILAGEVEKRGDRVHASHNLKRMLDEVETRRNAPEGTNISIPSESIDVKFGIKDGELVRIELRNDIWDNPMALRMTMNTSGASDVNMEEYFTAIDAARGFALQMKIFLDSIREEATALAVEYNNLYNVTL